MPKIGTSRSAAWVNLEQQWVMQAERDKGLRPGLTTDERAHLKEPERENFELRRANEILRRASAFFRRGGARMVSFIDDHRECYGVEPICAVLPIVPSTYYERTAQQRDPDRRSAPAKRDGALREEIARARREHFKVYGVRKVWLQLDRGTQYLSIRSTERLAEAGIDPSVGSVGNSYDKALAESVIGLYNGAHSPTPAVAALRSGGVQNARVDRLVQQPAAPAADRERSPAGVRDGVLP